MKVAIIGTGYVGSTVAYGLTIAGTVSELVLIDVNKTIVEGEVLDINHGLSFLRPMDIRVGDYSDCADAKIVVVAAGAAQRREGETRLDLIGKNAKIMADIVPRVFDAAPDTILLMVSNPVDVLTYQAYKISGAPANRIIGSGTILDSARFRYIMSQHCKVDSRSVHGYVIGEHGDSSVVAWSLTNIAGVRVDEFCPLCGTPCPGIEKDEISEKVKNAAFDIIKRKGATNFAIAMGVRRIVEAILRDEKSVLTVSSLISGHYGIEDVALSLPSIVGKGGVEKILDLPLNDHEVQGLQRSAEILKDTCRKAGV
jgi:L-lactate dehydrogenase